MPRHPSKGPGHGGPAKGFIAKPPRGGQSTAGERVAFKPGNTAAAAENRTGGSAYRAMAKEERIGLLTQEAWELFKSATQEGVKMGMVQYLMNREMGTPVAQTSIMARFKHDVTEMTDEELLSIAARADANTASEGG
jgi:hypothetical protein